MAREFARIGTDMPHEDRIRALNVGPAWLYDRLLMSREMSRCAVVPYRPLLWADLAHDATEAKVNSWIKTLVDGNLIVIDRRYAEVFVRTAILHDRLLAMPNVVAALVSDFRLIASQDIRVAILTEFRRIWRLDLPEGVRGGWLLAMGHYPEKADKAADAKWPKAMTADALGRIKKAIGDGLAGPMLDALNAERIVPFSTEDAAQIPAPFLDIRPLKGGTRSA